MEKLLLNNLLCLTKEEIQKTRIKLNVYNGEESPLEIFKRNPKDILVWNYWNNKRYGIGQISICLVRLGWDKWLLCHIGRIDGLINIPKDTGIGYTFTEDERYKSLYGRVIVKYHNSSRAIFRKASSIINDMGVEYPIEEEEYGTTIYSDKPVNLINYIDMLDKVDYLVLNSNKVLNDEFNMIVDKFINKDKMDDCYLGFFNKKTIFKVKNN
jgi:hypothetical protein